jgi:hypothetical protein
MIKSVIVKRRQGMLSPRGDGYELMAGFPPIDRAQGMLSRE